MTTLASILFFCSAFIVSADITVSKPLHLRIKEATVSGLPIKFDSGGDKKYIVSFIDTELEDGPLAFEPILFRVESFIWLIDQPNSRIVTSIEAQKLYKNYSNLFEKINEKPKLEIWISKHSDDKTLEDLIKSVSPQGKSTIWIRYFDSYPRRIERIFIHKPIAPINQIQKAKQFAGDLPPIEPKLPK